MKDGPFIEAGFIVGGYLIVNAKNINEDVEIAKGFPIFEEAVEEKFAQFRNQRYNIRFYVQKPKSHSSLEYTSINK